MKISRLLGIRTLDSGSSSAHIQGVLASLGNRFSIPINPPEVGNLIPNPDFTFVHMEPCDFPYGMLAKRLDIFSLYHDKTEKVVDNGLVCASETADGYHVMQVIGPVFGHVQFIVHKGVLPKISLTRMHVRRQHGMLAGAAHF